MLTTIQTLSWDYRVFSFTAWRTEEVWCSLSGAAKEAESVARQEIWTSAANRIEAEWLNYAASGWEPDEPIGPDCIKIRQASTSMIDITAADLFLGFITGGLFLIQKLILKFPRRYIIYAPIEFRVRIRRLKTQPVQVAV